MAENFITKSLNLKAHDLFLKGNIQDAINIILIGFKNGVNIEQLRQVSYYYTFLKKFNEAILYLKIYLNFNNSNIETLCNISTCYNRIGNYHESIKYNYRAISIKKDCYRAFDGLCQAFYKLGKLEEARNAGNKSLLLKDIHFTSNKNMIRFPDDDEAKKILLSADKKKKVCSFSIFGKQPRYLRGAIYNVIVGKELFPEWTMRFYVDGTVPRELKEALRSLDAEVLEQKDGQSNYMKLCWRFLVASDPEVGRFMVRDCDAAFSLRESIVVDEWLESGKFFHIIRDHFMHSDLILAGLWGGVSGIFPNIQKMLEDYIIKNQVNSSHIDQLFLSQCIWPTIKKSCIIHDRCFDVFSPRRPPMKHFRTKNDHIGANRFASDKEWQEKSLAPWIQELPCLRISPAE